MGSLQVPAGKDFGIERRRRHAPQPLALGEEGDHGGVVGAERGTSEAHGETGAASGRLQPGTQGAVARHAAGRREAAHADGPRGVAHQVHTFEAATGDLPGERSLSNSAATLGHASVRSDWVRAGILSYGSAPDAPAHTALEWDLRPAMTLRTRLIATQSLQASDTVGYGSRFTAEEPMRIGIAACGYADGYPRHCATGTPVLVNGQRTRTIGRVSMDMMAVDLSPCPQAGVGSEVTLWGQGPAGSQLPIDEVAQSAGTIAYELMCALAPRVPVRLVDAL